METRNANEVNQVDAVVKTPNVLEALWRAEGAGVTALTEYTGLPKSTVYVHLTTLRSKGYVVKNETELSGRIGAPTATKRFPISRGYRREDRSFTPMVI